MVSFWVLTLFTALSACSFVALMADPLLPSLPEISPEIAPLLPSSGGSVPASSGSSSSLPTIPSNPSPPNPDDIPSSGAESAAFSPQGSSLASSAAVQARAGGHQGVMYMGVVLGLAASLPIQLLRL